MTFARQEKIEPLAPYIAQTRTYYRALVYKRPDRWAENTERLFAPPSKSLAKSRMPIVTTEARFDPGIGDQGPDVP